MVYLDNAATSWPKPDRVRYETMRCMRDYCANPGRGGHMMSLQCGREVCLARQAIARFFNVENPMRICFTGNTTEALNVAIKGFLKKGMHVVTTSMEHNSVIRPLNALRKNGISMTVVYGNSSGRIGAEEIEDATRDDTRLVVCALSSNVNGIVLPIREIGEICNRKGIVLLVDAAQGAGSIEVNVTDMKIGMLAFPGHKGLLGPQGTGGLYVREDIELEPVFQGGTGSSSKSMEQPTVMPDMLESGTINTPGIVGLRHGIEFIENFGIENIKAYKKMLFERLYSGIEKIDCVRIFSPREPNSGILSLEVESIDSTILAGLLDKRYRIATRAGMHCAPLAHKTLGTIDRGLLRLSPGCFNTPNDIDYAIHAIRNIAEGD